MRCSWCGSENPSGSRQCAKCGRGLNHPEKAPGTAQPDVHGGAAVVPQKKELAKVPSYINHKDIPKMLKLEYSKAIQDPSRMHLEYLLDILERANSVDLDIKVLLQHVADTIRGNFGIDNVAIGLRSPDDGLFRYSTLSGFNKETATNQMRLAYNLDQFFREDEFNGFMISRYSKIYLAEDNEYRGVEKVSFNRPLLLRVKRKSLTESVEADYVDTFIFGPGEELLGWIEISGRKDGKLPDASTIRWVEAAAAIIAHVLRHERPTEGPDSGAD